MIKKHKNKLLVVGGLGLVAAITLVLTNASWVSGAKPVQVKNAQVQTIKVTKTYLDFQNSPFLVDFNGQVKALKIMDIPAGTNILAASLVAVEPFVSNNATEPFPFELISSIGGNLNNGSCEIAQTTTSNISIGFVPDLGMCNPNSDESLFLRDSHDIVSSLTQGSMDVYLTYITY